MDSKSNSHDDVELSDTEKLSEFLAIMMVLLLLLGCFIKVCFV